MKKLISVALLSVFLLMMIGCSSSSVKDSGFSSVKDSVLLKKGKVIKVNVSSLPEGYDYTFTHESTKKITDYLSKLDLISDYSENPNEYGGLTWVISLEYDDNSKLTIYHFGNMFIKTDGGSWYKMSYNEADRFNKLLYELSK